MATVNFSVPEDVENAFNDTFIGQNKSAIIASMMREAVEREQRNRESHQAIERIIERRRRAPIVNENEIHAADSKSRSTNTHFAELNPTSENLAR